MTPLPPGALEHLLQILPQERENPFSHLDDLSPDQLLARRVKVTTQIKSLEQERQIIDSELQKIHSDAELRFGVSIGQGWSLKQRTRTSWTHPDSVKSLIRAIQKDAQESGDAVAVRTIYLVLNQQSD